MIRLLIIIFVLLTAPSAWADDWTGTIPAGEAVVFLLYDPGEELPESGPMPWEVYTAQWNLCETPFGDFYYRNDTDYPDGYVPGSIIPEGYDPYQEPQDDPGQGQDDTDSDQGSHGDDDIGCFINMVWTPLDNLKTKRQETSPTMPGIETLDSYQPRGVHFFMEDI